MNSVPRSWFRTLRASVVVLLFTSSSLALARGEVLLNAPFITGSTRYPIADLVDAFASRIGQPVSRELLDAIAADIRSRYERDGFIAPVVIALDSELSSSTPRVHVFETTIVRIDLQGDAGPYADTLMEEAQTLRVAAIEKSRIDGILRTLNDLPGLDVRARFEPGDSGNRVALVLTARYDAVNGALSIDNRGSEELGRAVIAGRATLNGLFGSASAISLAGATSNEPDRYRSVRAGIERRLFDSTARLDLYDSRAAFSRGYEYRAQRARLELRTNAVATSTLRIEPLVGVSLRNAEGAYPDLEMSETRTRTAQLGVVTRVSGERNAAYARVDFERGFDDFGAAVFSRNGNVSDLAFSKASLDVRFVRALAAQWRMRVDLEAQWSDADLPSGERFTFGGAVFGRAFDPADLVGDSGGAASVQLEHLQRWRHPRLHRSSVYVQADYGYARDNVSGDDDAASLTGGLTAAFASLTTSLELSTPLVRAADETEARDVRAFVHMQIRF